MMTYFKRIQLNLLHSGFYRPTIERWATEGCLEDIKKHLGYRYVIRRANLATDGSHLDLQIANVGWGQSLISRPLYLISNGHRVQKIADLEDFSPGSVNRILVALDTVVDNATARLSLETDDQVLFSNITGNVLRGSAVVH